MRISVIVVVAIVSYHCVAVALFTLFVLRCIPLASIFLRVIISHELLTNLLELQMNEKAVNVLQGLCSECVCVLNGSDALKNSRRIETLQVFCFTFGK